jgi:MFS superfamily sulfate permease-like transporter
MKSIAAIALLSNLKNTEIASAGLSVAIALSVLALTGAIKLFVKYIPLYLIRGIQLGTGMALILRGIASINSSHRWSFSDANAKDNYLIAIISFCIVMGFWKSRITVSALVLFIAGMIIASTQVNMSLLTIGPKFWMPFCPSPSELFHGFLSAGLGQIPLTISNSVIAVVVLAHDLFPDADFQKITVTKISIWVAFMNFVSVWFGSMPFCCGSGGLAAQYRFGSRTKFSVIFLGAIKIVAGLAFGSSIGVLFQKIPSSIIGVLLVVAGFQISLITIDFGNFDSKELSQDAYLWYFSYI